MYYFWLIIYIIYGAVIGSFLNVAVYRLPLGVSVAKGRSYCDSCHHTLQPADLIPVFSWLFLKGRCRYCHQPISGRLPLVEAGNAVLYALVYVQYGLSALSVLYCLFLSDLLVMALIDHDTGNVYDSTLLILAILAAGIIGCSFGGWLEVIGGALIMSGPMLAIYLLSRKAALGSGDIWLAAIGGSCLGIGRIILTIGGGYVLALLWLIPSLCRHQAHLKSEIAMFPFFAAAATIAVLFGNQLIGWYLTLGH